MNECPNFGLGLSCNCQSCAQSQRELEQSFYGTEPSKYIKFLPYGMVFPVESGIDVATGKTMYALFLTEEDFLSEHADNLCLAIVSQLTPEAINVARRNTQRGIK